MPEDLIDEGHCINCYLQGSQLISKIFADVIEFLETARSLTDMCLKQW